MRASILIIAAALGLAGAAQADTPPLGKPAPSCFRSMDWSGWHAPDRNTIYLRVRMKDVYRLDLASGSSLLTWPTSHLINNVRGTDSVCGPIDLDLKVAEDGFVEPLFIKSITKLTPEQVAAIPKKDLP